MIDKNELQDLFVRLKLGTVSIDSAIEELERNISFEDCDNAAVSLLSCAGIDELFDCAGLNYDKINSIIKSYTDKLLNFICTGVELSKLNELKCSYPELNYIYDAGIVTSMKKSSSSLGKTIAVISASAGSDIIACESAAVLDIIGLDVSLIHANCNKISKLNEQVKNCDAAVIISAADISLLNNLTYLYNKPIICVPLSLGAAVAVASVSGAGILISPPEGGASAALAIYRMVNARF